MNTIFADLFKVFSPLVLDVIKHYMKTHDGKFPTPEETNTEFRVNGPIFLGEGASWKAANPKPPA